MGHSRTPTQNTAGEGFPADPIGGSRSLPESRVVTLRFRLAVVQCVRLHGQG
jgi:hypothetical protein